MYYLLMIVKQKPPIIVAIQWEICKFFLTKGYL